MLIIIGSQGCPEKINRKKGFRRVNIYDVMHKNTTHI